MLSLTESYTPLSFATRVGGALGGAYLGNKISPYYGFHYGLVNGANLGDFAADLIDRRDPSYAVRDLAYKTATGNAITGYLANKGNRYAGAAGAIIPDLSIPFIFGPDQRQPKIKTVK